MMMTSLSPKVKARDGKAAIQILGKSRPAKFFEIFVQKRFFSQQIWYQVKNQSLYLASSGSPLSYKFHFQTVS